MTYKWTRFEIRNDDRDFVYARVDSSVAESDDGIWVLAEDAIAREAQLLGRINTLETQAAQAAELISKAVGMMEPRKAG